MDKPTRIGVVLSGCGAQDGTDVHEAVLLMLAIEKAGAEAVFLAPETAQSEVIDHRSGRRAAEARAAWAEAARLARGPVIPLTRAVHHSLDAALVPGGMGAAKTLSNYSTEGSDGWVELSTGRLLAEMHVLKKPLGVMGMGAIVLAELVGWEHVTLTVGDDEAAAAALQALGARCRRAAPSAVVVDSARRIASTPGFLASKRLQDVAAGAEALVEAVLQLRLRPLAHA